ncbi:hypothetical protein BX661DRAFT_200159 [Kickxella alabastrina]|uniref:uncharacterized protein n=1 Tax=Kickxella alabastrina TaxID=61397 RepID=UPI00221E8A3D|nr:uncharacterized protein BX661DRAFT_200159 [Kickxella alabastrina]KAI7823472.1 hypothetical protein BX661DRAFT_200159 [Kickxella alabastrina]
MDQIKLEPTSASSAASETGGIDLQVPYAFMEYAANKGRLPVSTAIFEAFVEKYCNSGEDIHVCASKHGLGAKKIQEVVRAYYHIVDILAVQDARIGYRQDQHTQTAKSALFTTPGFGRLAIFGGQGGMDHYMEETRSVYTTYRPLVRDFVMRMAAFLKQEAAEPKFRQLYQFGLDLMLWLEHPEQVPNQRYMMSVPVCIPLVGLTQLMQVMVLYKTLGMTPGELADSFEGTFSDQGITTAAVLAAVTDEASFYRISEIGLGLLILCGSFPQLDYPMVTGAAPIAVDGQQQVTPMVSVVKLTREQLKAAIDRHNSMHALADKQVHLSLTNGARMFVVSGVVESLGPFVQELQREFDSRGNDQSRVAFSQRKPGVLIKFLSINAPYHCALLQHATEGACAYATHKGWLLDLQDMRRPVRASNDGHDIRSEPNIAHYLLQSMCMLPVDWPMAVACKGITHVVDFGPGGANGFGAITQRILEGRGVAVVCAGAFPSAGVSSSQQQQLSVASKIDLYASDASLLLKAADWGQQFRPRLVRTRFDGQLQIDTPMSRLLGKPPVMVAGMTPSTVSEVFVSAAMLRAKVDKILTLVDPGLGITVNSIYQMRREGVPMEGLCIGAGVPSFDVCNEIISSISAVGFRHIGLKPGSVATIRLVIKIAQANPNFPILLQWTSGRAGGHHSFEDFHQPILETYGAIRAQRNIVLVAGSGFGGVDDTLPYLTGEWSRRFDCAPMPFDGCLFGSRVMVAKEGMASDAVKEAIVAAPGIDDSEWEKTYQGPRAALSL